MNKIYSLAVLLINAIPLVVTGLAVSLLLVLLIIGSYIVGYSNGFTASSMAWEEELASIVDALPSTSSSDEESFQANPTPIVIIKTPPPRVASFSGPELWEAVNKRRQELGVNPLGNRSELCTIASIRLNELLDLGDLDGHAGFGKLAEEREDLKWIFETYNISEFLVAGVKTPEEAVAAWENTLGHKKLLTGGEYVWGCIYAQNGYGVAITAY